MARLLRYSLFFIISSLILILAAQDAFSQNADNPRHQVITTAGASYTGTIVTQNETSVTLLLDDGTEVTIRRENIRSMTIHTGGWSDNNNKTRYFFAPNAIPIGAKKGYYQNTWIFFNNVNYGLSDNFSIGGGFIPTFLFGTSTIPLWLLPKYTIPINHDKIKIALGGMLGGIIDPDDSVLGSLLYGLVTYGSENSNITAGLGYGLTSDGISGTPVLNISGIHRISEKWYLMSENYFFLGDGDGQGLLLFGSRYSMDRVSVDFGLLRPANVGFGDGFIGIPWLGISIPFDRN